jgi:GrpB-like predicted nucleotidyltransferase (UPF0157 family)
MSSPENSAPRPPTTDEGLRQAWVQPLVPLNGPVELADYDPAWPGLFAREAVRIRAALGDRVLLLEHTGSTSVPGLAAKPRIDMVLAVADSADEASYVPGLEQAGYRMCIREPGWLEHRVFKGPDTDVNLHVFTAGTAEIDRILLFRDWLRAHDADRLAYEQVKRDLAKQNWQYIQHYADAKAGIIGEIMDRAAKSQQTG